MKILVYGAGVLGCNLAHQLHKAGKDVTLLARNTWYETIKKDGLQIRNRLTHMVSCDRIQVINKITTDYDVIFVVVQNTQITEALEELSKNSCKNIILIGNNMNVDRCRIPDKNMMFGFYSAAGKRAQNEVNSFDMKKITIGRADANDCSNELIRQIFDGTKIKVQICNKMDDYLKSHGAFILPLALASYHYQNSLKPLKRDLAYLQLMIDATLELYDVLKAKGYEILPEGNYEFAKKRVPYMKFAKMMSRFRFIANASICDHAAAGKQEMMYIKQEFEQMLQETKLPAKAFRKL